MGRCRTLVGHALIEVRVNVDGHRQILGAHAAITEDGADRRPYR
ncbi:hypothetical protein OG866_10885 [Streptomyces sp. NBC_00663]|nr:hypothetical protein [Streptomyces sp. NBC_00663]